MYLILREKVDKLLVCNPTFVAKKSEAKIDFRDAIHLANELRCGHLREFFHDDSHWSQLRTSLSGYLDIVQEIVRFKNKHQFWGYCMLVRHIQESGGKIYGNKRVYGRRELRDIFIGAAENAMRSDSVLRDYYDSLRAKGTSDKDSKVVLART